MPTAGVGTLFATRNPEGENPSPGHWNHVAIMGMNGWVIEAQLDYGVVAVPFSNFYRRYPEIICFHASILFPSSKGVAVSLAALAQLGQPFLTLRSNCVTLIEQSVELVMEKRVRLSLPDDVVGLRTTSNWQKDDSKWKRPDNPFAGYHNNIHRVLTQGVT